MKVAILLSIARQVEGEYCFVKVLKASENSEKLFRYLRENDLPATEKLGEMDVVIEYGVLEDIEIDAE